MICAMLNFYDEDPEMLRECVESISFVDYLVALDGPYASYPHEGKIQSDDDAYRAIYKTCRAHDIEFMIQCRSSPWIGDEVAKRNEMLNMALSPRGLHGERPPVASLGDWLLVVDSDHRWEIEPYVDLKMLLSTTDLDFAEVSFADSRFLDGRWSYYELRLLMRAVAGMRYESNHYTTVLPDGSYSNLRRDGSTAQAFDLTTCARVHHHVHDRDHERRTRQTMYYDKRDFRELEKRWPR